MFTLTITVRPREGSTWRVVAEEAGQAGAPPVRTEGSLAVNDQELAPLDVRDYGRALGEALFSDPIKSAFSNARVRSSDDLHLLLAIEDVNLRALHWERLFCPIDNDWWPVAQEQRVSFALHVPTSIGRSFPLIRRADSQMLMLVANPPKLADYNLSRFDDQAAVAEVRSALGDAVRVDVLGSVEGAVGTATVDDLVRQLTRVPYPLLHIVCHGAFLEEVGETVLYLADPKQGARGVPASELVQSLHPVRRLPNLTFLASCYGAAPDAEKGVGGLAHRMVRELGLPAMVAMTGKVTVTTVQQVARAFYEMLLAHGQVDRALAEAYAGLANRPDILVPVLLSGLGGRPLFVDAPANPAPRAKAARVASSLDEGPVSLASSYYIERQVDPEVIKYLLEKPGVTVTIKGHRQVGKTSLLVRLLAWSQGNGRATGLIGFGELLDAYNRKNPANLFQSLGGKIASQLGLDETPGVWKPGSSLITYLTDFIEKRVLTQIRSPILLLFDDADVFFDLEDIRQDLFATLRTWDNKRASDISGRWGWPRLGMVISHATDPALWIEDLNLSPFSVGTRFELGDFDASEVAQLNERFATPPLAGPEEVTRLMALVDGHPYLTQVALNLVSIRRWTLARLETDATKMGGPFDSHLRELYNQVIKRKRVTEAIRQILSSDRCSEVMFQKLYAIGLVRGDSCDAVSFRCKIYEDYFKTHPV